MRSWQSRFRPVFLPLAIGAAVIVIPWFYLLWNTTAGELVPAIRFRTKTTIAGVMKEAAPILSLNAILTGTYQQWVSRTIGHLSPMFKPAIAWKNEIYLTVLGTAGTDQVLVGKHQELFGMDNLEEYCSRNLATLQTSAEHWASRIRKMQDYFERRGKVFVYIITPSKIAQEPEIIPDGYTCPAPLHDRTEKLKLYDEILSRHGVRYVDAASGLPAAREEYGISMFPRGGTHWNSLTAALGAQKVITAVNAQKQLLAPLSFRWRVSYHPTGSDRDLLDLLNMRHPDTHYPVPDLTYQSTPPPGGCKPATIAEVAGSFIGMLNVTLKHTACPPTITEWFYFDHARVQYAGTHIYDLPMDAEARRQSLLNADVVFLEENEMLAPGSKHASQMMGEVAGLANGSAAAPTHP